MIEVQIKNAVRSFLKVTESGDIDRALLFLAKDAEVVTSGKTFKGIAEIKKYLNGMIKTMQDYRVTENGMGIIAESNTGVVEHILSGTIQGKRVEIPAICIYEFKNDKIQSIRGFFDRLGMAKQAARGPFSRWMVNTMVNAAEKSVK